MAVASAYESAASVVLFGSTYDHVTASSLTPTGTIGTGSDGAGAYIQAASQPGNYISVGAKPRATKATGATWVIKFSSSATAISSAFGVLESGVAYQEALNLNLGDVAGTALAGAVSITIRGSTDSSSITARTPALSLNDGNPHCVAIAWNAGTTTFEAAVDGVAVTVTQTSAGDGDPTVTSGNTAYPLYLFSRNARGTPDQTISAKIYAFGRLMGSGFDLKALSADTSILIAGGGGADTTEPTLAGAVTFTRITQTSYTAQWPAGSDNVAVTGYEYQIGGTAGAWTNAGNNLSVAITGRTAGTTETVYVRAYDAAGNRSTPAISGSVTLESIPAAGINVTEPLKNNTGTVLASQSGVRVAVLQVADLVSVFETTGLTTNGSGILATISSAAITAGQQYHVAIKLADGSVGITGPITAS